MCSAYASLPTTAAITRALTLQVYQHGDDMPRPWVEMKRTHHLKATGPFRTELHIIEGGVLHYLNYSVSAQGVLIV
jgi:hypothetical protein